MPLSWNEIKDRALRFSREWKGEGSERAEALTRKPEPNFRYGTLECRMQRYLAGRQVAAVVAVADDNPLLVVVTVMDA